MPPVSMFLVTIAAIFLIGAVGEVVFRRTQVPDVIWLLLAGVLIGPVSGVVSQAQLNAIAPYFGALTLVVVLFDGGTKLDLRDIFRAAPRSGALSILTFSASLFGVAGLAYGLHRIGWLPAEWTWAHAVLLGAIVGGSSSIIIMPAMELARPDERVSNLVKLESAFTDAFCVLGAAAMIQVILAAGDASVSTGGTLARSFGLGAALGIVAGFGWLVVLRALQDNEHAYPITLSSLLILYVGIDAAGGSAALGILAFAIVVGNADRFRGALRLDTGSILSNDVRGFHRQVTFIVKSFFFTFIGAMLSPPWSLIALGVLFGVLMFVVRVPAVWLALRGSGLDRDSERLVTIAMPRGLAAGVLASMPAAADVPGTQQLPVLVFAAVTTSIVIFSVGMPLVRRRMPAPDHDGPTLPAPTP